MDIVRKKVLLEYSKAHADIRKPLSVWMRIVEQSSFRTPNDIKKTFASSDFVSIKNILNLTIFDIKGNTYRLAAEINYEDQYLSVLFIGTHSQYDKIDFSGIGG